MMRAVLTSVARFGMLLGAPLRAKLIERSFNAAEIISTVALKPGER